MCARKQRARCIPLPQPQHECERKREPGCECRAVAEPRCRRRSHPSRGELRRHHHGAKPLRLQPQLLAHHLALVGERHREAGHRTQRHRLLLREPDQRRTYHRDRRDPRAHHTRRTPHRPGRERNARPRAGRCLVCQRPDHRSDRRPLGHRRIRCLLRVRRQQATRRLRHQPPRLRLGRPLRAANLDKRSGPPRPERTHPPS